MSAPLSFAAIASSNSSPPGIDTLAELAAVIGTRPTGYVRYSKGSRADAEEKSIDTESGLELPGLSVNPLTPEEWWTRPLVDWLARQVCQYQDLRRKNPQRHPWVVAGRIVARGPDCEPLLVDGEVIGVLSDDLLEEARRRYEDRFDAGRGPED